MNPRTKNLVMVGGAVLVVGFVAMNTLMPAAPPAPADAPVVAAADTSPGPAATPSGTASPPGAGEPGPGTTPPAPGSAGRRSYAVGLHDLAGLAPDAAPGTRLELWVTWEPPLTAEPRLRKLIGDVVIERMIPGSVPEAPVTVLLSVPADRVGDLIYADVYGRLSVAFP